MAQLKYLEYIIDPSRPASVVDLSDLSAPDTAVPTIFVVGCPRSGTTAVANVLGANDTCVNGDESLFLLTLWFDFDELILGNNYRNAQFLASFTRPQKALTYLAEYVHHFYSDLLSTKPSAKYVIDHTPWYAHIFEFIDIIFPNAIYIHVIRDKDDTLASLGDIYASGAKWGQENIEDREALWNLLVDEASAIRHKAPGRYHEVYYEEFSHNPEASLKNILSNIGTSWQKNMYIAHKVRYAQSIKNN